MEKQTKQRKPTKRQKAFVEAMADPNTKSVRQAALSAGYAPSTASVDAYRLLENPRISEAIQSRIKRSMVHHQVTPEEVLGSAVFNMRTSMRDLLDDEGSYNFDKACETGAIDVVKKHKETRKVVYDPATKQTETTIVVEVELESPAAARKEVANYIGLENFESKQPVTDEEMFVVLFNRIIAKGELSAQDIVFGLKRQERFKDIDETKLLNA